jgi:hypothetical protein
MSDILDDYKNSGDITDYLYLQDYQVDAVVNKLNEYKIPHLIRPSKNLDDTGFVPLTAATKLNRPDFVIQIPNNAHFQVDELLKEHPELLHVSKDVRELFLDFTMDKNGWLEILIYPEEWEEGDPEIATKLLAQKGIEPTPQLLAKQTKILLKARAQQKEKAGLSFVQMMFITVLLILSILGALSTNTLF